MSERMFEPMLVTVEEVTDKPDKWRLCGSLRYTRTPGGSRSQSECYVVEGDFLTDFASVPSPFAWAVPRYGEHTKAAIVHDRLCLSKVDRFAADEVFRDALRDSKVSTPRRWLLWTGVTWGTVASVLRAVVLGAPGEPATDRVPATPPARAEVDLGCVDLGDRAVSPATATWARLRGLLALVVLVAGALALYSVSLSPSEWVGWPSYADHGWQRVLALGGLLALIMAALLMTSAVALWRLGLLFRGKLPGAWLVSTAAVPLVPIAAAAFLATLAYALQGRRAQSPGHQRLEHARANFIK